MPRNANHFRGCASLGNLPCPRTPPLDWLKGIRVLGTNCLYAGATNGNDPTSVSRFRCRLNTGAPKAHCRNRFRLVGMVEEERRARPFSGTRKVKSSITDWRRRDRPVRQIGRALFHSNGFRVRAQKQLRTNLITISDRDPALLQKREASCLVQADVYRSASQCGCPVQTSLPIYTGRE